MNKERKKSRVFISENIRFESKQKKRHQNLS